MSNPEDRLAVLLRRACTCAAILLDMGGEDSEEGRKKAEQGMLTYEQIKSVTQAGYAAVARRLLDYGVTPPEEKEKRRKVRKKKARHARGQKPVPGLGAEEGYR